MGGQFPSSLVGFQGSFAANMEPLLLNLIHSGLKMRRVGYTHPDPILQQALCQAIPGSRNEQGNGMEGQEDKGKMMIRVSTGTC